MTKRLDQVLVIDIEATCWEGEPPPGEESEVIEVGVCAFEVATGRRLGKESILVRPQRSRVSEFCTRLTTLTQAQVDGGVVFAEACERLRRKYRSADRVWASYGDYDRKAFERQCAALGVSYPFGSRHLNVKTLFGLSRRLPAEVGLDAALRLAGLTLEGTHHRGDDDAWNVAALLGLLLGTPAGA